MRFSASNDSILAKRAVLTSTSVLDGSVDNIEVDALCNWEEMSDGNADIDVEKLSEKHSPLSLGNLCT